MSTKLEKLLGLLSDNQWHDLNQITTALEIPDDKSQQVIIFLTETDLIQHNPATNQIRLNQNWKTLFLNRKETTPETQPQPETTAVGTIIIPPQKTLTIQCTRITNLTDDTLELGIRINKKIREIAINYAITAWNRSSN